MKIAIASWGNRVAPVFDTAREIHLVEFDSGEIIAESKISIDVNALVGNATFLSEIGIEALVCGAISRLFQNRLTANGVQVIPFVTGEVPEIIQAWMTETILDERFAMPGCMRQGARKGRQLRRRRHRGGVGCPCVFDQQSF